MNRRIQGAACAKISAKNRRRSLYDDVRDCTLGLLWWLESEHVRFMCVFSKTTTLLVVLPANENQTCTKFREKCVDLPFRSQYFIGNKDDSTIMQRGPFLSECFIFYYILNLKYKTHPTIKILLLLKNNCRTRLLFCY